MGIGKKGRIRKTGGSVVKKLGIPKTAGKFGRKLLLPIVAGTILLPAPAFSQDRLKFPPIKPKKAMELVKDKKAGDYVASLETKQIRAEVERIWASINAKYPKAVENFMENSFSTGGLEIVIVDGKMFRRVEAEEYFNIKNSTGDNIFIKKGGKINSWNLTVAICGLVLEFSPSTSNTPFGSYELMWSMAYLMASTISKPGGKLDEIGGERLPILFCAIGEIGAETIVKAYISGNFARVQEKFDKKYGFGVWWKITDSKKPLENFLEMSGQKTYTAWKEANKNARKYGLRIKKEGD